jgi:hypothetical protein
MLCVCIARQLLGKHVLVATNTQAIIEEILGPSLSVQSVYY